MSSCGERGNSGTDEGSAVPGSQAEAGMPLVPSSDIEPFPG